jgi:hypothetical protein
MKKGEKSKRRYLCGWISMENTIGYFAWSALDGRHFGTI